ncbi:hypothetical protein [Mucisphaera calidilacus]|nr:hypothetical protein [Mucisphaera calidilacus]
MVGELAERALGMAVDASPHAPRPREGERIVSLAELLPMARGLMGDVPGDLPDPGGDERVRWTDGLGHHRPSYGYLAARLALRGGGGVPVTHEPVAGTPDARVHADWVAALGGPQVRSLPEFDGNVVAAPLIEQKPDDSPDDWTYRELVGLHGLVARARATGDGAAAHRAYSVALHHVQHTQPDYTTYQPWALAWFLRDPATITFGEQQLHDVATHLSLEGRPGALVPALLLVDAWCDLKTDLEACG